MVNIYLCQLKLNLSTLKTRTHYGPLGSRRRTAERRGGAGLARTGRHRVNPARKQPSLLPSIES